MLWLHTEEAGIDVVACAHTFHLRPNCYNTSKISELISQVRDKVRVR